MTIGLDHYLFVAAVLFLAYRRLSLLAFTVTFTAPGSGASGTFAGGVNTAVTNALGVATAPTFTANSIAGDPYNVTASATGVAGPTNTRPSALTGGDDHGKRPHR